MLLRFKCKNLYSIRDEQELSLVAAKTRAPEHDEALLDTPIEGVKALRAAAIFGANASGKSNLLIAMEHLPRIVSESWRKWEPTGKIPAWMPFLLDDESKNKPASMEIDFVIGDAAYRYGFEFDEDSFTREWLIDISGSRDKTLFGRAYGKDSALGEYADVILFPGRNLQDIALLRNAREQTRPNSLFLSAAAQSGHKQLTSIYQWIVGRFERISPIASPAFSYTAEQCNNSQRGDQIKKILAASGTGIADFQVTEESPSEESNAFLSAFRDALKVMGKQLPDEIPNTVTALKRVTMLHEGKGGKLYPLPLERQSSGTRAFFELLGPILCELETGSVMLIDELESSLHPLLAQYIVKMFSDPKWNPRGAQLIFATHNPRLLDPDLLRRDQVWLVDKNAEGASEFRSLAEYKPRKGQNREEAYLNGRFGGIPFIDEEGIRSAIQPQTESSVVAQNGEA